ncbi:MAG: PAS domain S-box protein [Candidatus Korobacteraceae bacterium]
MDTSQPETVARPSASIQPIAISLTFAILSCVWILLSDEAVAKLGLSRDGIVLASILKGFAYVAVSAAIIYRLLRKLNQSSGNLARLVDARTTALVNSEAEHKKTRERFEQLLANLPDITWTAPKEGPITYISPNVHSILGFSVEEICGPAAEPWITRVHPDDQSLLRADDEALFKTGKTFDVEYRIQRKDGEWIWVHDRAVGTHDEEGMRFADGILTDVTERKRAEAARDASERRYRSLFERIPVGMFRSTLGGAVIDRNPALLSMFGYGPSDDTPMAYSSEIFFDPEDELGAVEKLLKEGVLTNFEIKLRRRDGTPLWALENVSIAPAEPGQPVTVEGTLVDITDRKRIEEELKFQREISERQVGLLSTLLGKAPVELAMFNREMRYLEASERWCKHYSLDRKSIIGRSYYDVFPNTSPGWKEAHQKGLAGQFLSADRDSFILPDGRELLLRWEIQPWGGTGTDASGIIIFSEDITEQCKLEGQFLKAQRMEAVGQLAAGIAHNFNNMLTVIMGSAQLIEDLPSDLQQVKRFADNIVQASRRSAAMVDQLLTFSRQKVPTLEPVDLNEVTSEVGRLLRRLLAENIDLYVTPAASTATVCIGRGQLEQVIMNLAVNSSDAMHDGGTLTIETFNFSTDRKVSQPFGPDILAGAYVVLSVTDTGLGMDQETRGRLFEPFFTTKPVGKGTGLGLATVYGLIKQCGGSISVESTPGEGTCFRLYLPHSKSKPYSLASIEYSHTAEHNEQQSILLVEDEPDVTAALTAYLQSQGYEVLSAPDGSAALQIASARNGKIDLLLTDVIMPKMGGVELAHRISSARPETKTLYMSGYADLALGDEEPGHVIQEPFDLRLLAQTIQEVLSSPDGPSDFQHVCKPHSTVAQ